MKTFYIAIVGVLLLVTQYQTNAAPQSYCSNQSLEKSLVEVRSLQTLPDEIRMFLHHEFGGEIMDRDEEFSMAQGVRHRFTIAGLNTNCAIVVVETNHHLGHTLETFAFEHKDLGWQGRPYYAAMGRVPQTLEELVMQLGQ